MGAQQTTFEMALLRLFGHPVLERDGTRTQLGVPPKAVTLLALIAANSARPLSREWLAQSLWPDVDPADARANLRRQLHLIAKAIGDDLFLLTRHTAQWNAASPVGADVVRFDTLAFAESPLALEEYAGDLCAGIDDELLDGLRLRYRSQYEVLLRKLTGKAREAGDHASLVLWLQRSINHDPFDEVSVRELMELREQHGDRAGALREYHALAQRLRAELGVDPDATTASIFNRVLYGSEPTRVPNNLVTLATSFVGRDEELATIARELKAARLITIVGAGGVGKTRLALRCAFNALASYPGGAWFVELENAREEESVWNALADVLGVSAGEKRDEAVVTALRHLPALVVLDNAEHLGEIVRGVGERLIAQTAASIVVTSRKRLNAAGEHQIELSPLAVPPEQSSDGESLLRYPAYRLFLERATTIAPAFRVPPEKTPALARILRRIDGLPLAIELVASRAHMLTLDGMLKRLAAGTPAIESTIAWSYDLLSAEERRIFGRLAVFHGKFTIDAVEAICGRETAVAALFEIVEASLAHPVPGADDVHYSLLATTRDFARARLSESGEREAMCRAHAAYFAALVERAPDLTETEYDRLFSKLHPQMDDLVAALHWCVQSGDVDTGAAIANGICRERQRQGYSRETLALVEALLESADLAQERPRIARAHRVAGILANTCTDLHRARFHNQRAYEMYRRLGDPVSAAYACAGIALAAQLAGDYGECEHLLREAIAELERSNHPSLLARTLNFLGELLVTLDRLPEACAFSMRAMQIHRDLDEQVGLSLSLKNLALIAFYQQDYASASDYLEEMLTRCAIESDVYRYVDAMNLRSAVLRASGLPQEAIEQHLAALEFRGRLSGSHLLAETFESTALTLAVLGEHRTAALLAGGAHGLRTRMHAPMSPRGAREVDTLLERLRIELGTALFDALWVRGQTEDGDTLALETREWYARKSDGWRTAPL